MNRYQVFAAFLVLTIFASAGATADDTLVKRIQAVAEKSKLAHTARDYSEIVDECDALLEEKIEVASHRQYLQTLVAWALDKRGATRVELSAQLQQAGNREQAERVLGQAAADFDRSLANHDRRWQTWMNRGSLRARTNDYAGAVADYGQVIELHPEAAHAFFNRAELHYQLKNYSAALQDYDQVLQRDATDNQALSGRGHCLLAMEKFDEAVAMYSRVVDHLPQDAWALANRADAWCASGRWQAARQDLEQAVDLQPLPELYRRLGWLLSTCPDESVCDGPAAVLAARRAVELGGNSPRNLDTLAAAYAADGQFDQARDLQTRVIAMLETEDPAAVVRQATYEKQERFRQEFER